MSGEIRPWGDWVAIQDPPADKQDGTIGGVILPDGIGLDKINRGIVLGVGDLVNKPVGFDSGCVVYYLHGDCLELGDGNLKLINDKRIIAWEGD